jgi:hypothetical protein
MPPRKKVLKQKQKQTQRQTVTVHINAPKAARKRKPRAKKAAASGSGSSQARVVAVPYMASNPNPSYGMFSAGDGNKFSSLIPQQQPAQEANPTIKTEVYKATDNPFITNYKNERSPILDDKRILEFLEEKQQKQNTEEKDDEFTHEEREENPEKFEVENPLIEPEQEEEDADTNEARTKLNKKVKTN